LSKKTFEAIKKTGNNAVIQVKDNQQTFSDEIKLVSNLTESVSAYRETDNKNRNRVEYRETKVFDYPKYFRVISPIWAYVACIIRVHRITYRFNTKKKKWIKSESISYYVATFNDNAKSFAQLIRGHWGIEDRCHYIRDTQFCEDLSRIRIAPVTSAILRSFAMNILRFNKSNNIRESLVRNTYNFNKVLRLKGIA
jgi:predicted transposase YbfD/YdcC